MENKSKLLISELSFCVFDLETTGGHHSKDKIIEIGLVKIDKMQIVAEKNFLINPEMVIPDFIQNLTKIRQSDVKDSPLIEDVIQEILDFMGDSVLVAHNTSFDIPFFNSVLKRLNLPEMPNKSICTNLMTKYLIPNLLNSNLNYMCSIFNINHQKAHRALDDAQATAELFIIYLNIFIEKKINKINHLYYPRNRFELDQTNFSKKDSSSEDIIHKIKNIKTSFLLTLKGSNGTILFSYPSSPEKYNLKLIKDFLTNSEWHIATIKLSGPFLESFIKFTLFYPKIEVETRNKILDQLYVDHSIDGTRANESKFNADFIISNHLVPDQYIIIPLTKIHPKNALVFRFPGHQKKLLQYISSRSNKQYKSKEHQISTRLLSFIKEYINQSSDKTIISFVKELPLSRKNDFLHILNKGLSQNPNTYNYPKEYI